MYLQGDKNRAAENCPEYQSEAPLIAELSSMALNCSSCINYKNGSCSRLLADKIYNIISIN